LKEKLKIIEKITENLLDNFLKNLEKMKKDLEDFVTSKFYTDIK